MKLFCTAVVLLQTATAPQIRALDERSFAVVQSPNNPRVLAMLGRNLRPTQDYSLSKATITEPRHEAASTPPVPSVPSGRGCEESVPLEQRAFRNCPSEQVKATAINIIDYRAHKMETSTATHTNTRSPTTKHVAPGTGFSVTVPAMVAGSTLVVLTLGSAAACITYRRRQRRRYVLLAEVEPVAMTAATAEHSHAACRQAIVIKRWDAMLQ